MPYVPACAGTAFAGMKKEGFLPGICSVLHTFGSKLDFHPHIHILLTLGGLARDDNFDFDIWKDDSFFPEKILKTVNPADIQ